MNNTMYGIRSTDRIIDFWFCDRETGEEFFVEESVEIENDFQKVREHAFAIAREFFIDPRLIDVIPAEEAEMMGLDTY